MANPEHRSRILAGFNEWNDWRSNNPEIEIDLSHAMLARADLTHADLSNADLSNADLTHADLSNSDLSNAKLSNADLRNAVFDHAVLRGARLFNTKLQYAKLRGAILSQAELSLARLWGADLSGADLNLADLRAADLSGADLSRANFNDASLLGATLEWTNIDQADLSRVRLKGTIFAGTDLRGAKGLDLCFHEGPSTIGIDTLVESSGDIPEIFLRGCGVPDQFITYTRSLVGSAIEFYSCFISYSTKDQDFADRLYADLQNNGVRCWFAPHDIQGGRKIHEQIDEAIRVYERLLLILSDDSMKSSWVETEISKARKRESREKRQMLFPVRLVSFEALQRWKCFDADTGKDSAREIREYLIPDFSKWKDHDSYKQAFNRLLRDLTTKPDAMPKPA